MKCTSRPTRTKPPFAGSEDTYSQLWICKQLKTCTNRHQWEHVNTHTHKNAHAQALLAFKHSVATAFAYSTHTGAYLSNIIHGSHYMLPMTVCVGYLPAQITNYIVGGTCNGCHLGLHNQVHSGWCKDNQGCAQSEVEVGEGFLFCWIIHWIAVDEYCFKCDSAGKKNACFFFTIWWW